MKKKKNVKEIIMRLKMEYPHSKCSLIYETPFQLLVATILSAQCTDERVNKVTSKLFEKYPDAKSFSREECRVINSSIVFSGIILNYSLIR